LANIENLTNAKPAAITVAAPRDGFSSGAKETAAVGAEIVEDNRPNVYTKLKYFPMK
jgi:hypothetical protein